MVSVQRSESSGWEVVTISSEEIAVTVVPGLGGTVVSIRRLADDLELLWRTPWGLRPPGALKLPGLVEAWMLDSWPGGWQTVFPNGSDNAIVRGVEWGYDGEARIAWFDWSQSPSSVMLTTRLTRTPFEVQKVVSVRGSEVTVGETVKNVGADHVDVVWGQQITLGPPLLGPGAAFHSSASVVRSDPRAASDCDVTDVLPWPRAYAGDGVVNLRSVPAAGQGQTRMAYLSELSEPSVTLSNAAAGVGVHLSWDGDVWPHLWYGLEAGGRTDYPWYGTGYFLSLTPSTSWPARGIHEVRRTSASTLRLQPGRARTSHLSLRVLQPGR